MRGRLHQPFVLGADMNLVRLHHERDYWFVLGMLVCAGIIAFHYIGGGYGVAVPDLVMRFAVVGCAYTFSRSIASVLVYHRQERRRREYIYSDLIPSLTAGERAALTYHIIMRGEGASFIGPENSSEVLRLIWKDVIQVRENVEFGVRYEIEPWLLKRLLRDALFWKLNVQDVKKTLYYRAMSDIHKFRTMFAS